MRLCKVKDCDRNHSAKGYCFAHYQRKKNGIPFTLRCKQCNKVLPIGRPLFCCVNHQYKFGYIRRGGKEYHRKNYTSIPCFGKSNKGAIGKVFTNGFTEQMRELVPKIKNDVLNDCIKHPRKYLEDVDEDKDASS